MSTKTSPFVFALRCVLLMGALAGTLLPQTAATDGTTPTAMAPGSPAGSYSLSGLDTVNPYTGLVNLQIPIHTVGGRGKAGYTMMLPIQRNWIIKAFPDSSGGATTYFPQTDELPHKAAWTTQAMLVYQPGRIAGRQVASLSSGIVTCPGGLQIVRNGNTLTRLTWTAADGTETDFVDSSSGGNPLPASDTCSSAHQGPSRGTVFVATDGSGATFIASSTIFDSTLAKPAVIYPAGSLFLADGTRYDVLSGEMLAMADPNGNTVQFSYGPNVAFTATDELNRVTQAVYANISTTPVQDVISFPGVGGAQRSVTILYQKMDMVMLSGQTTQDFGCLFPELTAATGIFDPWVVASVTLPNSQAYSFKYNSYGDVVQVTLPTGGVIEYDYPTYAGACPVAPGTSGVVGVETIQRRITQRRVRPNGPNTTIEQKTDYVPTFGSPNAGQTTVLVKNWNGGGVSSQEKHYYFGDPTQSLSLDPATYNPWQQGKEFQTDYLDGAGTLLRTTADTWQQHSCVPQQQFASDVPCWFGDSSVASAPTHYPAVIQTDTTLESGQVARTSYAYDQYNNKTSISEYDYGSGSPGSPLRTTKFSYLTNGYDTAGAISSTIHLRRVVTDKQILDPLSNIVAETQYVYDESGLTAETSPFNYVAPGTATTCTGVGTTGGCRGNLTSEKHSLGAQWLTTTRTYDNVGNVLSVMDPNNTALAQNQKKTTYSYTDSGTTISNTTSYAFPTTITNTLGQATTLQYDYNLGQPTSTTDPNQVNTSFTYGSNGDMLDRLSTATRGSGAAQTAFTYTDTPNSVSVTIKTDRDALTDGLIQSKVLYDGLGRKKESQQLGDPCGYITTVQNYDFLGRPFQVSNPYRPLAGGIQNCTAESGQFTTTTFDALGRVKAVTTPDTAATVTSYSGNQTTVTDPAGVTRTTVTDAAGRIQQVIETKTVGTTTSTITTNYLYDPLDDLTEVCQGVPAGTAAGKCTSPVEDRKFMYDSMGRLTSASNVEASNPTTYSYDNNGNLTSRVDANNVTTSMAYDALNRIVTKSYNDTPATPAVTYCYDGDTSVHSSPDPPRSCSGAPSGVLRPIGHLMWVNSSVSQMAYTGFDLLGNVTGSKQTTGSSFTFSYSYNLASALTSITYPSNRGVTYTYDSLGRVSAVNGAAPSNTSYASTISYASHGPITQMTLGGTLLEKRTYSSDRLQPLSVSFGTSATPTSYLGLNFYYCPSQATSCSTNNGNMISQVINPLGVTQTYSYTDGLNRLTSAKENITGTTTQNWSQTYGYDDYGNRALVSGSSDPSVGMDLILRPLASSSTSVPFDAHNHWTPTGVVYDSKGNLQTVTLDTNNSFQATYDGENRQTSVTARVGGTSATTQYRYDGDGRRVQKILGSGATTTYVYDAAGQLAAEYLTGATNPDTGTQYLSTDHLGSTRAMVTLVSGTVTQVNKSDYLPFGQEIPTTWGRTSYVPDSSETMKFTSKERDAETGLDYFGARYMSSAQGRFTIPDPLMASAHASNPQTWNRYVYTLNDPLVFTDPTGLYTCKGTKDQCNKFEKTRKRVLKSKVDGAAPAAKAYGDPTEDNGIIVQFADKLQDRGGTVTPNGSGLRENPNDPSHLQAALTVTIQTDNIDKEETVAHEGSHVEDYQAFASSLDAMHPWGDQSLNITRRASEIKAYELSIRYAQTGNNTLNFGPCGIMDQCKFQPGLMPALRDRLINQLLDDPRNNYTNLNTALYPEMIKPQQK